MSEPTTVPTAGPAEPAAPTPPVEPETAATPTEAPETPPVEPEQPEPADDREAAKYRRKLRDTEGERDALTERLTTLQRAEVARLAADVLAAGDDIWLTDVKLADLLDDTGNVDAAKVNGLATNIAASRPHWKRLSPNAAPAATVTSSDRIEPGPKTTTWSDVLQSSSGTSG